jgi:hypothetical protein
METRKPHVRTMPLSCAPSHAPCPACGNRGRRKQVLFRRVRTIAFQQLVFLDVTYGEYRARVRLPHDPPHHPAGRRLWGAL